MNIIKLNTLTLRDHQTSMQMTRCARPFIGMHCVCMWCMLSTQHVLDPQLCPGPYQSSQIEVCAQTITLPPNAQRAGVSAPNQPPATPVLVPNVTLATKSELGAQTNEA